MMKTEVGSRRSASGVAVFLELECHGVKFEGRFGNQDPTFRDINWLSCIEEVS